MSEFQLFRTDTATILPLIFADGKSIKFVNAIRRAMKSPDYSTSLTAFKVG